VACALTLEEARRYLQECSPQVIVLDIELPDGNGVDFCREIRYITAAPLIFLTFSDGYETALAGLRAGGDDYLVKPFDLKMFVARIESFLRRDAIVQNSASTANLVRVGGLEADILAQQARFGGRDLGLAQKEFALLLLFMQNEGRVLSKEQLYEPIWKTRLGEDAHVLWTQLSGLKGKLSNICGESCEIATVRGLGYRFTYYDEYLQTY
jgi:DNA-binding response OmpR family regulator